MTKRTKRGFGSALHRLVLCRLGRHDYFQPSGPHGREDNNMTINQQRIDSKLIDGGGV